MGLVKQAAYTGSLGHLHPSAQLRAVDLQMLVELGWTLFSLYTFFHTLYCHRSQKGKLTRGELSYNESRYPSLTVTLGILWSQRLKGSYGTFGPPPCFHRGPEPDMGK